MTLPARGPSGFRPGGWSAKLVAPILVAPFLALPLLAALLAAALNGGCSYDPHPANGALHCSAQGECPQGYTCDATLVTCFADGSPGSNGSGGAGTGGTGAMPGTGGATVSTNASDYVGSWAFGPLSAVATSCDDGNADTSSLANTTARPEVMTIVQDSTGVAALKSSWLCDVSLNLDGTGAHIAAGLNSCTHTRQPGAAATDPESQTWTATKFDVSTTTRDRVTATHTAEYTRVDVYSLTRKVTCKQTVHAGLQKL